MKHFALLTILITWAAPIAQVAHAALPPGKVSCSVRLAPLSVAEMALSREDFDAALTSFQSMSATAPNLSRNGVVRVLLGQNDLDGAKAVAEPWLASEPSSPAAVETSAEFLLRDGRVPESLQMARKAFQIDPCNARAHLIFSVGAKLSANYATAAEQARVAHALDPQDIDIRRAWISTLPRSQKLAEYLALSKDERTVSPDDHKRLAEYLDSSNAHVSDTCRVTSAFDQTSIPLKKIMDGPQRVLGIALRVQFNDKKKRLLELDSGAFGLMLTRGAARTLGLVRDVTTETAGVGDKGAVATSIASVASVRIGNLEFAGCPVRILEKNTALDVDGLIGADVFRRYLVTIDYPGNVMRLAQLPKRPDDPDDTALPGSAANDDAPPRLHDRYIAPEMQDWTRIFREGHELLLPVSIGETRERLFIVDTGSSSMMITPDAARAVTKVRDSAIMVHGISGDVKKVYATSNFVITFAHLQQKVDSMTAINATLFSHGLGVEVSGFVGAPVLQLLAIHIDYRDNLIKFDYKPR